MAFLLTDGIFIIHGHDELNWIRLSRLLRDEFGIRDVIVLKEEPSSGKTLIEKLEYAAKHCCYAFAVLTPDDMVEKPDEVYFQSRPNVIFEIGWFYGRLGRDRVCIVKNTETTIPSDLIGIVTINFNNNVSEVYLDIKRELNKIDIADGDGKAK
jgi:predicted nucleotide-binding protein